jgi:hypothetical protein
MSIRSTFSSSAFFLSFLVFSSGNLCSVATGQPWGVTIAVLGSSTAFGTGPSHADSAWVNRYRKCITDLDSSSKVVNLALGGYTTYHMLPDDFVPPANRPAPDPARNITQALSLYPFAIIINLPSNDAASGYSISEQLSNYDLILEKASAAGVPVWISTTQP